MRGHGGHVGVWACGALGARVVVDETADNSPSLSVSGMKNFSAC